MLDISKATNMLTSLGVSSTLAAKVAERAAQNQGGTDALAFLKELQATLKEFSTSDTAGSDVTRAAPTTVASTKPYQSTSALYSTGTETNGAAEATAKAPFNNLTEFKAWEKGLGDTLAEDYQVPDYVRMISTSLGGGDEAVVSRYMFFKNNPEFAADYAAIRSGELSKFPTDGSTLVKSDLSTMPTETAAYYKGHTAELLASEGFNMDPTLAKMRKEGTVEIPEGANPSNWLMSNNWTANGIVAQDNRTVFAHAPYIGLDGKGADTYRRTTYDATTNSIIDHDGIAYDPMTGEARA